MKKTSNIILIIFIVILCVVAYLFHYLYKNSKQPTDIIVPYATTDNVGVFSDGLQNPDSVTKYDMNEFDIGVAEKSIYYVDINNDGTKDKITKIFTETGNAHSYYSYTIELNRDGKYIDITPNNFKTTNGASCDLQQIQFSFNPEFKVTIISRNLGETWDIPTMAYHQEYTLSKSGKFKSTSKKKLRSICDVKELF